MPVIYVDVLIAVNAVIDCFLIRFAAALMKVRISGKRLLLGSCIGGAGSLLLLVKTGEAVSFLLSTGLMLLIVAASFGKMSLRGFLRCSAVFFVVDLLFAGAMLLIITAFFPERAVCRNGAVYFDVDILTVVLLTVACYAVLSLASFIASKKAKSSSVCEMRLIHNGKTVRCKAFHDTGNMLRESFSGAPVIVVSESLVKDVLPEGFASAAGNAPAENVPGFRLIPFSTVGGGGVLPAFRPDEIQIFVCGGWHRVPGAYAAVRRKNFSGGEFEAVVGTPVLEAVNNEV